jgi:Fe-S-cluster-containing dehydrogenase component
LKRLYIDYTKCVGCELCAIRCSVEKTGACNPSQARIHLVKEEEKAILMPAACRHCEEPKCLPACPVKCIHKDPATGLVSIDPAVCIGCRLCQEACPYGGPVGVPRPGGATKPSKTIKVLCDLCAGHPTCVDFCPTGALEYISLEPIHQRRQDLELAEISHVIAERKRQAAARKAGKGGQP